LPKALRRNLIPAPDTARKVVAELRFGEGSFVENVAKLLTKYAGEPVPVEAVRAAELPQHFQMNVRVVDDKGKTLGAGRDLGELRDELGVEAISAPTAQEAPQWHRDGITRWDFGTLPESVEVRRSGVLLPAFPTLVDRGANVSLRLLDQRDAAQSELRGGVRRLVQISEHRALQSHVDWFPELKQLSVLASKLYSASDFKAALAALLAERAYLGDRALPRSDDDFQVLLRVGRSRIDAAVQDLVAIVSPLVKNYHAVRLALENPARIPPHAVEDLRLQLSDLIAKDFLTTTPWTWLTQFPRYLSAMQARLQKISQGGGPRDRQLQTELNPYVLRYRDRRDAHQKRNLRDAELATYRWWLEEYRVSIFAQQLGTSVPISAKRLDQQWQKVT